MGPLGGGDHIYIHLFFIVWGGGGGVLKQLVIWGSGFLGGPRGHREGDEVAVQRRVQEEQEEVPRQPRPMPMPTPPGMFPLRLTVTV